MGVRQRSRLARVTVVAFGAARVKDEVRAGRLAPAAAKFSRAARALKKTIRELRSVPPPPADRGRLSRWLDRVSTEAGLFEAVAAKLRAGQKAQAERMVVKLTNNANHANNMVTPFEFGYCRLEPAPVHLGMPGRGAEDMPPDSKIGDLSEDLRPGTPRLLSRSGCS